MPPDLTHVWVESDHVHAATDADSAGQSFSVTFDRATKRWSRLSPSATPSQRDTLSSVRVFGGSLFDKLASRRIDLGDGYTLVRGDSGIALEREGKRLGWPAVTEEDLDDWAGEVRLGLPRDEPSNRLWQLLAEGRLQNVPGPFVRAGPRLWFGLAGGFTGGDGQLGGLVYYDTATGQFGVIRHKFIVDAAVTCLFAHGNELWIGTGRYGPSALEGLRGLILFRPERREWRQFSPENTRISGDLIWDIALDGRHLWATTNRGVSRYDLDRRLWDSWYWHPAKDGGFELRTRRPENLAEELIK